MLKHACAAYTCIIHMYTCNMTQHMCYLPRAHGSGPPSGVVALELRIGGDFGVSGRLRLGQFEDPEDGGAVHVAVVRGTYAMP